MRFQFAFKHMETSEPLKEYAESKIRDKVLKFVTKPIEATVTFSVDKHLHKVHCDIMGGDGFNLHADFTSADMYASVDNLLDKIEVQLKKHKEKLKDHHKGMSPLKNGEMINGDPEDEPMDASEVIASEKARHN